MMVATVYIHCIQSSSSLELEDDVLLQSYTWANRVLYQGKHILVSAK